MKEKRVFFSLILKEIGMKKRYALTILTIILLVSVLFSVFSFQFKESDIPMNIILFIGDGMGVSQVTTARIYRHPMHLERLKTMGLLTTYSNNRFKTDSAAAGTALATGYKTDNGVIAQSPDGEKFQTIAEYAKTIGKSSGVVASTGITHATPASFLAHKDSRGSQAEIAEQIAAMNFDVLFGAGWGYFVPATVEGSLRNDEKDLLEVMRMKMQVVINTDDFETLEDEPAAALLERTNYFPKAMDNPKISLADMTRKALQILSKNNKGFFLMVEGSQMDWGGHSNDVNYIMTEMLAFDDAIGIAMDFAEKNGKTLVIVTADHETGGLTLLNGSFTEQTLTEYHFSTTGHTAEMVPVFSYGPSASLFGGIQDNTEIGKKMFELWK